MVVLERCGYHESMAWGRVFWLAVFVPMLAAGGCGDDAVDRGTGGSAGSGGVGSSCPASPPGQGVPCSVEGQICSYAGEPCGVRFTCTGGSWDGTEVCPDPPDCPPDLPEDGETCNSEYPGGATRNCSYPCPDGSTASALCATMRWYVTPCSGGGGGSAGGGGDAGAGGAGGNG